MRGRSTGGLTRRWSRLPSGSEWWGMIMTTNFIISVTLRLSRLARGQQKQRSRSSHATEPRFSPRSPTCAPARLRRQHRGERARPEGGLPLRVRQGNHGRGRRDGAGLWWHYPPGAWSRQRLGVIVQRLVVEFRNSPVWWAFPASRLCSMSQYQWRSPFVLKKRWFGDAPAVVMSRARRCFFARRFR